MMMSVGSQRRRENFDAVWCLVSNDHCIHIFVSNSHEVLTSDFAHYHVTFKLL
jgi:hypothetical protein